MSRSTVRGEHLPHAYPAEHHEELTAKVDGYFADPQVQKAMRKLSYLMSTEFRDRNCPVQYFPRTVGRNGGHTYINAAEDLRTAVNQTQKAIAETGGYRGMIDTSYAHERLGLLLNNVKGEFRNDMSVLSARALSPSITDSLGRLRLRYALALELKECRTTGSFTDEEDTVTKITHGLHMGLEQIGASRLSEGRIRRGYSHGASDDDLREIWSYGQADPDPKELFDRMQGMDFRHRKIHEFGESNRSQALDRALPESSSIIWHTLTTEVGGAGFIRGGERPSFFGKNPKRSIKHIGPVHPEGRELDFCRIRVTPLEAQLQNTIDQITELLYDWPK